MARTNLTRITRDDLRAIADAMGPLDTITVTVPTALAEVVERRRAAERVEKARRNGTELAELRLGGRNFIRPGDTVKVAPRKKGARDGFVGSVQKIVEKKGGVEIEVYGAPGDKAPAVRTFSPERLSRTRSAPTHRTAAEKRAEKQAAKEKA